MLLVKLANAESEQSATSVVAGTVVRLSCDLIGEWLLEARRRVAWEDWSSGEQKDWEPGISCIKGKVKAQM